MAKNNNLTDFLTGVADAIRTKKGTTELINPQNFENEILSIETGGGGTSAILGELNVSSNGTYEAGSAIALVPGGMYQFKEQLPVETLTELYAATQGNSGVIFSVVYQGMPLTQLKIHKTDDIYILESNSSSGIVENIYSTGTTTFTYYSLLSSAEVTVELTPGWNTVTMDIKSSIPVLSKIRLPQDISGIPKTIVNLVDLQFDTSNCVEAVIDESSTAITIEGLGQFVKLNNSFDLTKRFALVSAGSIDEFHPGTNSTTGELTLYVPAYRNMMFSNLQDDIEGIKYLKYPIPTRPAFSVYVEDASKIQITSGTAENGCWYLEANMSIFGADYPWTFAYDKDLVDGYNKVTVNVPSSGKLQSKTATSNGVYTPDEGFDGLSQVTVDFALQNKTITRNEIYTCDEGYGGLGEVIVNVKPNLQNKTITKNGTYTASTGYDGLKQVTVNVTTTADSKTLLNNGKLAVHTVTGADDLSLDTNKATIEELIVNDGVTSVSKGTGYTSLKRVVLPDTLETIGNQAFDECNGLTKINIPDSVTSIGNYAFYKCSGLTSITIPNRVTRIGDYAFENCSGLTSINIPNSVTNIGTDAFYGCGLNYVSVDEGNTKYHSQENCLIETADKKLILGSNNSIIPVDGSVTKIENGAFSGCSEITSMTIPFVGYYIGAEAGFQRPFGSIFGTSSYEGGVATKQYNFGDSGNISTYYIPASLKSVIVTGGNILRGAFYNCKGLTSITIPDGITSIEMDAFRNCSALTSINIPDTVTSIGSYAFSECKGLTSPAIGNNTTSIGNYAFAGCTGFTDVVIPDSITSIGEWAFRDCTNLTSVTIPDSVTSIKSGIFQGCSKLISVNIPSNITIITNSLFYDCDSLTDINIPDNITTIGSSAFGSCSGLTSITIPDSVTSIGGSVFKECSGLTDLTIPFVGAIAGVTESSNNQYTFGHLFGGSDFVGGVAVKQSYKSSGSSTISETVYLPSSLKNVTVTGGYIPYHAFQNCSMLTSITMENGVTSIGGGAFENCTGLISITIPDSVTSIGNYAFENCTGLTSIIIPDGVTNIGSHAFKNTEYYNNESNWQNDVLYIGKHLITAKSTLSGDCMIKNGTLIIANSAFNGCSGLTSVTIPNSVTNIGTQAFEDCSGLTNVTIGNGVTSIGAQAFQSCHKLTSVSMGNSVTSIGNSAFQYCRMLTSITIPNSVMSIGSSAFDNCSALTSIIIPDSVTSIGSWAFKNCSGLTNVIIMSTTPPALGTNVFLDTTLTQITVPAGCGEAYKTAEKWSAYADYIIEEGMHRVTLGENVTCSVEGTSYSNQTFDVADQTVIHFEVGQPAEGGAATSTPDGIFLNGTLVSSDSEPATYDLTVTGNVSVTYSTGDIVGDITYNHCYKIVMG